MPGLLPHTVPTVAWRLVTALSLWNSFAMPGSDSQLTWKQVHKGIKQLKCFAAHDQTYKHNNNIVMTDAKEAR